MKNNLIFILVFMLQACVRTLPDEELTMTRTPYTSKEFRIDGCYITNSNPESYNNVGYTFFYSNGIVLSFTDSPNIEQRSQIPQGIWSDKEFWGVFSVTNNTISVQGWKEYGSTFIKQMVLKEDKYTIINDTTLYFENSIGYKAYYYFKKFSPKPDSTNVFIK